MVLTLKLQISILSSHKHHVQPPLANSQNKERIVQLMNHQQYSYPSLLALYNNLQLKKNYKIIMELMEGVTSESPYFSHQSFSLLFCCFSESVMVCFYDDQLGGRRVEDKLAWSVP